MGAFNKGMCYTVFVLEVSHIPLYGFMGYIYSNRSGCNRGGFLADITLSF
jgi:hypothetical protein